MNEVEVLKICREIDTNKSSAIPNISCKVLKDTFIGQIHLLKQIFETGIFPDEWKKANITPLQKDGNVHSVNNLRPVSLLPLPSKIVEKIIHDRMMHHLETNLYLDVKQGGFRKNNSTINTVSYFTNDIFNSMIQREYTLAAYIDMAKAFDTVNHSILLKKLEKLGFIGKLLELLRIFFGNRKQCTMANRIVSSEENITYGIPQGSTVGPLMHIIYVNDIITSIKDCKYYMYADDTVIYTSGTVPECTNRLTSDLSTFKLYRQYQN